MQHPHQGGRYHPKKKLRNSELSDRVQIFPQTLRKSRQCVVPLGTRLAQPSTRHAPVGSPMRATIGLAATALDFPKFRISRLRSAAPINPTDTADDLDIGRYHTLERNASNSAKASSPGTPPVRSSAYGNPSHQKRGILPRKSAPLGSLTPGFYFATQRALVRGGCPPRACVGKTAPGWARPNGGVRAAVVRCADPRLGQIWQNFQCPNTRARDGKRCDDSQWNCEL